MIVLRFFHVPLYKNSCSYFAHATSTENLDELKVFNRCLFALLDLWESWTYTVASELGFAAHNLAIIVGVGQSVLVGCGCGCCWLLVFGCSDIHVFLLYKFS